jgi:hypothetical protein
VSCFDCPSTVRNTAVASSNTSDQLTNATTDTFQSVQLLVTCTGGSPDTLTCHSALHPSAPGSFPFYAYYNEHPFKPGPNIQFGIRWANGRGQLKSVQRVATGWRIRGSNSRLRDIFRFLHPSNHPVSCSGYRLSSPGVKRPGRGVDQTPTIYHRG